MEETRHLLLRDSILDLCLVSSAFSLQLASQAGGAIEVITAHGNHAAIASSPSVLARETLYIARQDGRTSDGSLPGDFQEEINQSLRNVQAVLREACMDFDDVVWMHIYVRNARDLDEIDEVCWRQIVQRSDRTVLVVGGLPDCEKIEISCIAVAGSKEVINA